MEKSGRDKKELGPADQLVTGMREVAPYALAGAILFFLIAFIMAFIGENPA